MSTAHEAVSADDVLKLLRGLPPRERLHVIAAALPEAERQLEPSLARQHKGRPSRLRYGALQRHGRAPSEEDIDAARRDVGFPRHDV